MQREAGVPRICFVQQVEEPAASLGNGSMDSSSGSAACRRLPYSLGQYKGPEAGITALSCSWTSLSLLQEASIHQCSPIGLEAITEMF